MWREGSIRFGPYTLDEQRGLLLRDGETIHLRAKTFGLLTEFARNPGTVLGKDDLMARIWPGLIVTEDSLTQAISELRRVLGEEGACIRTLQRRGYIYTPAAESRPASARDGMPLLAVFPFHALSPDDAILAEGLAEETTHGLGCYGLIEVAARHSAFRLRPEYGAAVSAARQLGATHYLEGIVRPRADGPRLSVSLCETSSGRQLWGETFDLGGASLSATASAIPHRIVTRLNRDVERAIALRSASGGTDDLGAYQHFVAATALLRQYGPGVNERASEHLEAALRLDPDFALAHAYLGLATILIGDRHYAVAAVKDKALALTLTGVRLAPEEARCHWLLSVVHSYRKEYADVELHSRRGLDLNPFDADLMAWHGLALALRGRPDEGLPWINRARLLNPLHPDWYHIDFGIIHQMLGNHAEALAHLRCLPPSAFRLTRMAACEAMLGNAAAAADCLDRAEALSPGWDALAQVTDADLERTEDRDRFIAEVKTAIAMRDGLRTQ